MWGCLVESESHWIDSNHPARSVKSYMCVGRRWFFLAKTLGKSLFHGQNDWSGHGPPASSDFCKAPLNENFHFGGQQCSVATLLALNASLILRVETNFAILMTIIRHLERMPRSYISGENGYRKRSFAKTLFRVEIFENAGFSFPFGRTKTEVFEYDDVKYHIQLFRERLSEKNVHATIPKGIWDHPIINTLFLIV